MISRSVLLPLLAGVAYLSIGLAVMAMQPSSKRRKFSGLGRTFVATALAVFGMEHLVSASGIMRIVPAWIPGPYFWTYLVGIALFAAATSFVLGRYVPLAATLLGAMFVSFVLLIHLPRVIATPGDRTAWAVFLRELAFAGGAWALAGDRLAAVGRILFGAASLFFAIEHFLHPEFAPGVPLAMRTPVWMPAGVLWGYLVGAVLLMAAMAALTNRYVRRAATWLGIALTLTVLLLYVPNMAKTPAIEPLNYVADTLLFAGAAFLLADGSYQDTEEPAKSLAANERR